MTIAEISILAIAVALALLALFLWNWTRRRVRLAKDNDERKNYVEMFKVETQVLSALGLISSAFLGVLSFDQQARQSNAEQIAQRQRQNSDQFQIAIGLLEKTSLSSVDGGLVIVRRLTAVDPNTYAMPAANVIRASILEMQSQVQPEQQHLSLDPYLINEKFRLLVDAYILASRGALRGEKNPDARIDLTFLDASDFLHPDTTYGIRPDYHNAQLPEASFVGVDYKRVNFAHALLSDAKFFGAKISHASFQSATLTNASFISADLQYADFTGANLQHARLNGANLKCANFRAADLRDATIDLSTLAPAEIADETVLPSIVSRAQIDLFRKRQKINIRECETHGEK